MSHRVRTPDLARLAEEVSLYCQLRREEGARGVDAIVAKTAAVLKASRTALKKLPPDPALAAQEPDGLRAIQALRPRGPRRMWTAFDEAAYRDRLEGALLARMAGCTLGAPVEFWDIEQMRNLAKENSEPFPPQDYWSRVPEPFRKHYRRSPRQSFTRRHMNGVPVDDDIAYTLLGLLVVEEYGPHFTIAENGKAWLKHLPYACTAEEVALANLRKGVPAARAADINNPYCAWIGAAIRADPWGYLAPGWPELAADMAFRDARISHRRNGVYGEMYFAAAIAAAFAVDDPVEALHIGLTEIPRRCSMAEAVRWALKKAPVIRNYRQAREAAEQHFRGMHRVHAILNACLTVWGITIGGTDVSRVIGETVAMGYDNDCTAATAGSIVGAVVGRRGVPPRWTRRFHNTIHSYLTGKRMFRINNVINRFTRQAVRIWNG